MHLCRRGLSFRRSTEEEVDEGIVEALRHADWPTYTILCPLYHETRVVPQFARAMTALDNPAEKLQILFLTEADDADTVEKGRVNVRQSWT